MRAIWMQELTSFEVEKYLESSGEVIVPIGSTETHGPHLPLGTDTYEAIDYAEGIAQAAGIIVAPPIWFGDSAHHMHKSGTISLEPETVIAVLKDVYTSLVRHGFSSIITFNGHRLANLPAIGIASRAVKRNFPKVHFACLDPLVIAARESNDLRDTLGAGLHGGELETSHMLFKRHELVHQSEFTFSHGSVLDSRFVSVDPLAGNSAALWYHTEYEQARIAPLGHIGDPQAASAAKGKQLFDIIVGNSIRFIEDLRKTAGSANTAYGATGVAGRKLMTGEVRDE